MTELQTKRSRFVFIVKDTLSQYFKCIPEFRILFSYLSMMTEETVVLSNCQKYSYECKECIFVASS